MTLLYKAVPKGQPGVVGGGTIKFYACIVHQQPIHLRKFVTDISKRCTLAAPDIYAVVEAFLEQIHTYMEEGRIIKLGELGSFSPALSSGAEDTPADVGLATIKKINVNFRPSQELQYRLSKVRFQKTGTATYSSEIVE